MRHDRKISNFAAGALASAIEYLTKATEDEPQAVRDEALVLMARDIMEGRHHA